MAVREVDPGQAAVELLAEERRPAVLGRREPLEQLVDERVDPRFVGRRRVTVVTSRSTRRRSALRSTVATALAAPSAAAPSVRAGAVLRAPRRGSARQARGRHGRDGWVADVRRARRRRQPPQPPAARSAGVQPGDHVALCMENHPRYLEVAVGLPLRRADLHGVLVAARPAASSPTSSTTAAPGRSSRRSTRPTRRPRSSPTRPASSCA